jgi:hypothetical protein
MPLWDDQRAFWLDMAVIALLLIGFILAGTASPAGGPLS